MHDLSIWGNSDSVTIFPVELTSHENDISTPQLNWTAIGRDPVAAKIQGINELSSHFPAQMKTIIFSLLITDTM
jgi:hypothetical protein